MGCAVLVKTLTVEQIALLVGVLTGLVAAIEGEVDGAKDEDESRVYRRELAVAGELKDMLEKATSVTISEVG
jgi:hypothetical protein